MSKAVFDALAIGMRERLQIHRAILVRNGTDTRHDLLTTAYNSDGMAHATEPGTSALLIGHSAVRHRGVVQALRSAMSRLNVCRCWRTNGLAVDHGTGRMAAMTILVRSIVTTVQRGHRIENFVLLWLDTHFTLPLAVSPQ